MPDMLGLIWLEIIAWACLTWYLFIVLFNAIGSVQISRRFSQKPPKFGTVEKEIPHVTIIRPCKGVEPYLYDCLAATFHQDYPGDKLTVCFCVSSRLDPAFWVVQKLVRDFSGRGAARVYVEEDDPQTQRLGPNPKIRNMSRAYREAEGDVVWILDCNVWVNPGACGRMVDRLCGLGGGRPYKFVHHLPVAVAVKADGDAFPVVRGVDSRAITNSRRQVNWGGRLEELFLSTAHAKFYTAINTVGVAPCINGKSNMFRRSHLDYLAAPSLDDQNSLDLANGYPSGRRTGLDHFSENICEDHIIGDLLWHGKLPVSGTAWGKHALILDDLAFQPIANMSLGAYVARRVRWLRVRKFTVTLATLVEPGTESLLCSAYGAFACATLVVLKTPREDWWVVFWTAWLTSVVLWAALDRSVSRLLRSGATIEVVDPKCRRVVPFISSMQDKKLASGREWLLAWFGREVLALPIWIWAFWGGVTVVWRDRRFWVGMDMKVHEVEDK